jgi:hypothetical protein
MADFKKGDNSEVWKLFFKNHWKMFAAIVAVCIIAIIGAIYVFLWFVADAQLTGLVPETLGLWSMGYLITFLVQLVIWEFLYIGIPVLIAAALFYLLWWKRIPIEERMDYRRRGLFHKGSKTRDGGGALSFLINVFVIIKVYLDGNWSLAFGEWTVDYLVLCYLTALLWVAIIFGIPITLGVIAWAYSKMKK